MHKALLLFYSFLFFCSIARAQNLVPNYSFEDTVACPFLGQIDKAAEWSSNRESPDYFNICSTIFGVPSNQWGHQFPHFGNAYSGLATFSKALTNLREYMGVQLIQPLIIGQKYYLLFFVSRAVSPNPYINVATNKIGARFSTVPYSASNWAPINNYAQVYTDSIIVDTINWVKISGSFIADSAYQYLSIGNFFEDSVTSYLSFDSTSHVAYYYIDDVFLSTDSTIGIQEINSSNEIKIFPIPTTSSFTLHCPSSMVHGQVTIYNSLAEKVHQQRITSTTQQINLSVSPGVYFLKAGEGDGRVQKVVVY
jgi:hypothetical protein